MKAEFSRIIIAVIISLLASSCRPAVQNSDPSQRIKGHPDKALRTNNAFGHWEREAAYNERAARGNAELIFVGDSITQRWNGQGKQIWQKFYSSRNALNLGIDGDRTQNVLWRLENGNIDGISPKAAVVLIGTNNASDGDSAEDIAAGIIAVCNKIRQKLPQTQILLMGIFPRGEMGCEIRDRNAKAGRIASKIADGKMIHYMDIGEQFLEPDGSISKEIMYDSLHLTPKGYQVWAEAIEPKLAEIMGQEK
ncbi:MAG: GDSL family lipase [Candidatus Brocadiia bacterium]|nr:MAG: GDSL family lipase [Candidatus Brocadiia bacterium]